MDRPGLDRHRGRAPDYTNAALFMGWVNLVWILWALWAIAGLAAPLALAFLLHYLIGRVERRA